FRKRSSEFISMRRIFEEIREKTDLKKDFEIAELLIPIAKKCHAYNQYQLDNGKPMRLFEKNPSDRNNDFDYTLLEIARGDLYLDDSSIFNNYALQKSDFYYEFEVFLRSCDLESLNYNDLVKEDDFNSIDDIKLLLKKICDLENLVRDQDLFIEELKNKLEEFNQLTDEINEKSSGLEYINYGLSNRMMWLEDEKSDLEIRIKELESRTDMHPALDPKNKHHAPELLLAIHAWESKYIHKQYPHQEHSPAIKAFLSKSGFTVKRLQDRIAAITNPKNINKSKS
ncbi:hypothetical protein, partial [Acinetobacter baumannii]|uniref:hypothetical protein n=1 Tax=Acinetobacter baumannii TaxID=470 RepID=UPI002741151E